MTALPRRQQNRLNRERAILDAALKVFAATGYSGATMDAVAAEAGVTKPTLYSYFPSKESLFQAMMLGKRDLMLDVFEHPLPQGMVADLVAFAWTYADTVMRPEMLSLARPIIGEVQRFPEIGRAYQASGPDHLLRGIMRFRCPFNHWTTGRSSSLYRPWSRSSSVGTAQRMVAPSHGSHR